MADQPAPTKPNVGSGPTVSRPVLREIPREAPIPPTVKK